MGFIESLHGLTFSTVQAIAPRVASWLGPADSKLVRGIRGQGQALRHLAASRDRLSGDRHRIWVHAPSVGEGLQARAVIEALRQLRGDVEIIFTHFSPSAEALAASMPAQIAGYLPWDAPGTMREALEVLRPDLVVFTKTEVWPTLSRLAAERGVATALIGATLPETSSRTGRLARALLRPSYVRLQQIHAVTETDRDRFLQLGARETALEVIGDPGIDSAAARALAADPEAPWLRPFLATPAPTVIAGSTWPADEAVLVPALRRVRERVPGIRLIIAPHEPTPQHVAALHSTLEADGWRVATLTDVEQHGLTHDGPDAIVVDRVGVLAPLYTAGTVALVGGGFHDAGLHSVLEPAAARLPVVFGPRHHNAVAAADLLARGGAAEVPDVTAMADVLSRWLTDADARAEAADASAGYITAHLGAAERSARRLLELLA
jgi:3-deoxy-D-manno-octulosonic-acid transferase